MRARENARPLSLSIQPTELVHDDCDTRLELQCWCTTCNVPVPPTQVASRPGPGRVLTTTEAAHG